LSFYKNMGLAILFLVRYRNLSFQFTTTPGEVPVREFKPSMPLPSERANWQTACEIALSFWLRAANDTRISEHFRSLAQANHDRLVKLRQCY